MKKKTILVLTIQFGAGHLRAAQAVAQACGRDLPDCDVTVVDVTPFMSSWFRWLYVDLYLFVLRYFPWLWRWFEKIQRAQPHTSPVRFLETTARRVYRQIGDRHVAAIVSTEVGAHEIGALLKSQFLSEVPLIAVLTDYDVDRAWIQSGTSFYCAGSVEVRDELTGLGAAPGQVYITGIPVDQRFPCPESGPARNVPQSDESPRPRVLLAGGGEGLLNVVSLLKELDGVIEDAEVTVLTGTNRRLQERLLRLKGLRHIRLHVQGWTDRVPDQFHSHDLLISKPGGLTMTEAMAAGLPQLACFPLPGAEVKHCALIEKWGIGLSAQTWNEFREKVRALVADEVQRRRFSSTAQRLFDEQHAKPAAEVVREALSMLATPHRQLKAEFDEWAEAGRGEQMEKHHHSIAQSAIDLMKLCPADRILDLGCGTGWASRRIAESASRGFVCGVDISDAMIERARRHPANPSHLCFRTASADALPFPEDHFDKIFSCESFYYYPDLSNALREIVRVLAPGGKFFCLVNLFKENPYTHVWVELLKVKAHLLGEADYVGLFNKAGLDEVQTRRIPDLTPVNEADFKPGWGVNTLNDLKAFRAIGALLVMGRKPGPAGPS